MTALASLKVSLNGTAVDPVRIKYAGVTPWSAGLYQINLVLPDGTGERPRDPDYGRGFAGADRAETATTVGRNRSNFPGGWRV